VLQRFIELANGIIEMSLQGRRKDGLLQPNVNQTYDSVVNNELVFSYAFLLTRKL